MAMNAATLKAAIHADLAPALIEATSSTEAIPIALWTAISEKIATIVATRVVAHIQSNAQIAIPVLVTACPAGAGATTASSTTVT